jgi:6-pyruvoyltetrahydropterin/6-carboxytetrahydropterin synthase
MFELSIEDTFPAAHRLPNYPGACSRLHGHNYRVRLTVRGPQLNPLGLLLDFGELKRICRETLAPFDHQLLNDLPEFREQPPTSENLARVIFTQVASRLPSGSVRLVEVTVFESETARASYREE